MTNVSAGGPPQEPNTQHLIMYEMHLLRARASNPATSHEPSFINVSGPISGLRSRKNIKRPWPPPAPTPPPPATARSPQPAAAAAPAPRSPRSSLGSGVLWPVWGHAGMRLWGPAARPPTCAPCGPMHVAPCGRMRPNTPPLQLLVPNGPLIGANRPASRSNQTITIIGNRLNRLDLPTRRFSSIGCACAYFAIASSSSWT
jgi:hypothetical protein